MDTDSDDVGGVLTRKSTCVHCFRVVNLIKAGSWAQGTRSVSVAESEFERVRFLTRESKASILHHDD